MAWEVKMSKYLPAALGITALLIASTALANDRSELERSSVKAATDCVAAAALNNPNIISLYQEDRLKEVTDWIVLRSSACDNPIRTMRPFMIGSTEREQDEPSFGALILTICPAPSASELGSR
jgi:hypothetical protein